MMSKAINQAIQMLQDYKYDLAAQSFSDNDEGDMLQRRNENKRWTVEVAIAGLRAELAALKAGQGEAVAIAECREVHGHMCQFLNRTQHGMETLCDGDKLYTAPVASADAVSVAPGLERAIQIVREVAKTQPGYSDEREAIFEALSEAYVEAKAPQHPPASADALNVSKELLGRATCLNQFIYLDALQELRAMLAQSESKESNNGIKNKI